MKFTFSMNDQSLSNLEIDISEIISDISYNGKQIDSFTSEELFNLLNDYKNNSYASNVPYEERLLIKKFKKYSCDEIFFELLRTFACSTFLFHFIDKSSLVKSLDDKIKDSNFHIFDNNFYVDWTGDLGIQPSVYYLSNQTIKEKKGDIEKLFDLGFLGKLTYEYNSVSVEYYFIPLKHRKVPKFQLLPMNSTVTRILSEREDLYSGVNK